MNFHIEACNSVFEPHALAALFMDWYNIYELFAVCTVFMLRHQICSRSLDSIAGIGQRLSQLHVYQALIRQADGGL